MAEVIPFEPELTPATSKDAWLSALPFGLVGVGVFVATLPIPQREDFLEGWLKLLYATILLGFCLALIGGGKRWAGGWFGFVLVLGVNVLPGVGGSWDSYAYFNTVYHLIYALATFVILPLFVLVLYWIVFRGDRLRGLLMTLPWMLMVWIFFLELVPPVGVMLVLLVSTIISMSAAYWMTRAASFSRALCIAALAALLLGLSFLSAGTFLSEPVVRQHSLAAFLSELLPNLISSLLVVVGPLLGLALWRGTRRLGGAGLTGFALAAGGLLCVWLGSLGAYHILTAIDHELFRSTYGIALSWLGLLGWLIIAGGALYLALIARAEARGLDRWSAPALALLCGAIPLVALILVAPGNSLWSTLPLVSRLLFAFGWAPAGGFYLLALVWLAVSAWLVVRLDNHPR